MGNFVISPYRSCANMNKFCPLCFFAEIEQDTFLNENDFGMFKGNKNKIKNLF
jgi:hypothetical protein